MRFSGRSAIITGAGQGIGRALAEALAARGVRLFLTDQSPEPLASVSVGLGAAFAPCDVANPKDVEAMICAAETALGPVDMLFSNAGFARGEPSGPTSAPDEQWQQSWDVHVMAHLRASRILLPGMLERGEGWLINVASAAGLLSQIGDAAYSATKHAAVSLAQSLAIEHGAQGIHVSVVCPLYVATPLLGYQDGAEDKGRLLSPSTVAETILDGLRQGQFLILPHPEAGVYAKRRAADMDRWIAGMQRLHAELEDAGALGSLMDIHKHL